MQTTIPDAAINLIAEALDLAPTSTPLLVFQPCVSTPTLLRQIGTIAGIASVLALGEHYAPTWKAVEGVALLSARAIESHLEGDDACAYRLVTLARMGLVVMREDLS